METSRPRRRGCLGALVALVLVVVVLLVVADRVAEVVVAHRLEAEIQSSQSLATRPHVDIGGFPFLTQVLRGRYAEVSVTATSPITVRDVAIDRVVIRLRGVRVGLSDAVHGRVDDLPVAATRGRAVVPYSSLDAVIAQRLAGVQGLGAVASTIHLVGAGAGTGEARLEGPLGLSIRIGVRVQGQEITFLPRASQIAALPAPLGPLVSSALATPVALPRFPFGIQLTDGAFEQDGLQLTARASDSVFPIR